MELVFGLGNPGRKYASTRHNVGFMVVDALALRTASGQWLMVKKLRSLIINHQSSIILAKPQTFMNRSGEAVEKVVRFYKVDLKDLYVVHDDLDIELGTYKIQLGKGPREHNGLSSIYKYLGSKKFWHVRLGIENRKQKTENKRQRISGEEYVLQRFTEIEKEIIEQVVSEVGAVLKKRLLGDPF